MERTEDFAPRQALAERLGWEMTDLMDLVFGKMDESRVQLGKISYTDHWKNVAQELSVQESEIAGIEAAFFAGDTLDTALVDEICALKTRYTTAILSNYSPILREKVERIWQIADAFDHVVISSEEGVMKPDPAIYQIALEKVGCRPEEAVFLDDFIENVEGARKLGMHAVWFKTPKQGLAELQNILKNN